MTTVECVAESLEAARGARAWREVISARGETRDFERTSQLCFRGPFRGSNFREGNRHFQFSGNAQPRPRVVIARIAVRHEHHLAS